MFGSAQESGKVRRSGSELYFVNFMCYLECIS